jgi:L-asparaginase
MSPQRKVLVIYTGGTIGMVMHPESGALIPFDFEHLVEQVPEIKRFNVDIRTYAFEHPIDSSDMQPGIWVQLATIIEQAYHQVDGFVVLHGSDTMAFTASALSYMLVNLAKPVVLTGSQLPIGTIRTDGKENLITAIEIASTYEDGKPVVPEVCVYFEYKLFRGNRTLKFNSEHFNAFYSPNYSILAEAGVTIDYHRTFIRPLPADSFRVMKDLDNRVGVLKLFPGISKEMISAVLNAPGLRAVVMETFGSGNGPTGHWFIELLAQRIAEGLIVVNITQCIKGEVVQGRYSTSEGFKKAGVIGLKDMTFEAAVTKLMFLLANYPNKAALKQALETSLAGEISMN